MVTTTLKAARDEAHATPLESLDMSDPWHDPWHDPGHDPGRVPGGAAVRRVDRARPGPAGRYPTLVLHGQNTSWPWVQLRHGDFSPCSMSRHTYEGDCGDPLATLYLQSGV